MFRRVSHWLKLSHFEGERDSINTDIRAHGVNEDSRKTDHTSSEGNSSDITFILHMIRCFQFTFIYTLRKSHTCTSFKIATRGSLGIHGGLVSGYPGGSPNPRMFKSLI